jgi:nitrogen fixation NifU-like protein
VTKGRERAIYHAAQKKRKVDSANVYTPDCRCIAGTPPQGPFLILDLQIRDDIINDVRFQTCGCGPAIACGSMLTVLIIGKSTKDARSLTAKQNIKALDGVPDDKMRRVKSKTAEGCGKS